MKVLGEINAYGCSCRIVIQIATVRSITMISTILYCLHSITTVEHLICLYKYQHYQI